MPTGLLPYGKTDWTDYVDYWRDADVTWMQDRLILRVADDAGRIALGLTPGGVVYNAFRDRLELQGQSAVIPMKPLPDSLSTDVVGGVTFLRHTGAAAGEGVGLSATEVSITKPLNVMSGTVRVVGGASGYLAIKSGTNWEATLTTTGATAGAAVLVSSVPMSMPSLTLTGTGTVLSASGKTINVGTLTAADGSVSGAFTVTGVLKGGLNSLISGVAFRTNYLEADSGYVSQYGCFRGQSDSAVMSWRHFTTGALGACYLQTTQADIVAAGGNFYINSQLLIRDGRAIYYYSSDNNYRGNIAPSVYSATDPNASLYPDGTIWVS